MDHDLQRALGRIEGQLTVIERGINENTRNITALDTRLRHVEATAARNGALLGTAAGIFSALISLGLQSKLGV